MKQTPAERLARLEHNARKGWRMALLDARCLAEARAYLCAHPSGWAEVDALWRDALEGRGPLALWLEAGGPWADATPLHSILSSHPFPMVSAWSIQQTFRAS